MEGTLGRTFPYLREAVSPAQFGPPPSLVLGTLLSKAESALLPGSYLLARDESRRTFDCSFRDSKLNR